MAPREESALDGPETPRRHGRVLCQEVTCSFGEVQNLSGGGMRVRMRRRPPQVGTKFTVTLETLEGPMPVECTVAWTRRVGLFTHEAGLHFETLDEATRTKLNGLARASAHNETIRPDIERARKAS